MKKDKSIINALFFSVAMTALNAFGVAFGDERQFLEDFEFVAIVTCDPSKNLIHEVMIIKKAGDFKLNLNVRRDYSDMIFDPAAKSLPSKHKKCVIYGRKFERMTIGVEWVKSDDHFVFDKVRMSTKRLVELAKGAGAGKPSQAID